eukprot:TRINITY_DN5510_c0_g1_i1.p1 TRINITY_DN5510_c0_g1~~TRINITY_DN5510_c0_g1_i1.p1  ORF type:complete len:199 (-),score=12.23 TRINITY_DN5510_c0_g1_i1:155-751(-)
MHDLPCTCVLSSAQPRESAAAARSCVRARRSVGRQQCAAARVAACEADAAAAGKRQMVRKRALLNDSSPSPERVDGCPFLRARMHASACPCASIMVTQPMPASRECLVATALGRCAREWRVRSRVLVARVTVPCARFDVILLSTVQDVYCAGSTASERCCTRRDLRPRLVLTVKCAILKGPLMRVQTSEERRAVHAAP